MKFLLAVLFSFPLFFLYDLFLSFIPGLIFVRFSSTKRLGVHLLARSGFGSRLCPKFCPGQCDDSCPNWTCPNFHACMPKK